MSSFCLIFQIWNNGMQQIQIKCIWDIASDMLQIETFGLLMYYILKMKSNPI